MAKNLGKSDNKWNGGGGLSVALPSDSCFNLGVCPSLILSLQIQKCLIQVFYFWAVSLVPNRVPFSNTRIFLSGYNVRFEPSVVRLYAGSRTSESFKLSVTKKCKLGVVEMNIIGHNDDLEIAHSFQISVIKGKLLHSWLLFALYWSATKNVLPPSKLIFSPVWEHILT